MKSLLITVISSVAIASSTVIISTPAKTDSRILNRSNKIESNGTIKTNSEKDTKMCYPIAETFALHLLWQNFLKPRHSASMRPCQLYLV